MRVLICAWFAGRKVFQWLCGLGGERGGEGEGAGREKYSPNAEDVPNFRMGLT